MFKTGISLGGGCLRGVAHIGALKEMLKYNISITHVAGTSAGAVVGGLYASGLQPDDMVDALDTLSIRKHLDFGFNRKAWLKGDRIYNTLLKLTDGKCFSDLDIPLSVVCVDLNSRKVMVINEGEVAKALRASIAIPGVFSPVEMGGKLLVDGYINNPADVVKTMGANHVTAVRVQSSDDQKQTPTSALSYINRYMGIASSANTDELLKKNADILIDIDLVNVGRFDSKSFSVVIERGQAETSKILTTDKGSVSDSRVIYMEKWIRQRSS